MSQVYLWVQPSGKAGYFSVHQVWDMDKFLESFRENHAKEDAKEAEKTGVHRPTTIRVASREEYLTYIAKNRSGR